MRSDHFSQAVVFKIQAQPAPLQHPYQIAGIGREVAQQGPEFEKCCTYIRHCASDTDAVPGYSFSKGLRMFQDIELGFQTAPDGLNGGHSLCQKEKIKWQGNTVCNK